MEKEILVSIIIPVYNGEKYLEEAVNSVINQPCKNVEVILINDGSSDNSGLICQQLEAKHSNIKYWEKGNTGIGATRNFGIKKAKGKYLAFLDQDDMWFEKFLNKDIENLLEGDADVLGFSYYRCNGNMTRGRFIKVKNEIVLGGSTEAVNSSWNHHSSFLYNRKMVQEEKIECPTTRHEDEIFRHKCLYVSKKIIYCDRPIFMYRNNSSSETHRKQNIQDLYGPILDSWNELIDWHRKLNPNDEQIILLCKKMICIYGVEGIELLYRNGVSEKKIREIVKTCLYEETLKNFEKFNLSNNNHQRIAMYFQSHVKFSIKNRCIGFFVRLAKRLKNVSFIQKLYEARNYPIIMKKDIEN